MQTGITKLLPMPAAIFTMRAQMRFAIRHTSRAISPQVVHEPIVGHLPRSGRIIPDLFERLLVREALQEVFEVKAALRIIARLLPGDNIQAIVANPDRWGVRGSLLGGPEDADGVARG